jgi:TolB-like protein
MAMVTISNAQLHLKRVRELGYTVDIDAQVSRDKVIIKGELIRNGETLLTVWSPSFEDMVRRIVQMVDDVINDNEKG